MTSATIEQLSCAERRGLAREVVSRQADLTAATERWLTRLAANLDQAVERLGVVEDAIGASDRLPPGDDELARRRAQRGLEDAVLALASVGAALRLGPPPAVGYRLAALVQELEALETDARQDVSAVGPMSPRQLAH